MLPTRKRGSKCKVTAFRIKVDLSCKRSMLLVFRHRQRLVQSIVWPTPSPTTHPKLTHPAAQSLCDSWATCLFSSSSSDYMYALLLQLQMMMMLTHVCVCVIHTALYSSPFHVARQQAASSPYTSRCCLPCSVDWSVSYQWLQASLEWCVSRWHPWLTHRVPYG